MGTHSALIVTARRRWRSKLTSRKNERCAVAIDLRADLAVANNHSDNVSVLLGNGDGTFATTDTHFGGGSNDGTLEFACVLVAEGSFWSCSSL